MVQRRSLLMARADHVQFNVRSAFARARAHELAKLTGMTATQIVEDALRGYVPPAAAGGKPGGLVKRGPLLVKPASGKRISAAEAEAALDVARERDLGD
jgi:hypothetical protein